MFVRLREAKRVLTANRDPYCQLDIARTGLWIAICLFALQLLLGLFYYMNHRTKIYQLPADCVLLEIDQSDTSTNLKFVCMGKVDQSMLRK